MRTSRKTIAAAAAVAVGAVVAVPLTSAVAGHENTLAAATLNGRQEVPAEGAQRMVGDADGKGRAMVFGIDGDPTTLCYSLVVRKIGPAVAAHIHEGARGENGPVVANLAAPADGTAADCLTDGEEGKFAEGTTAAEILANPEDYYVNVHNERFPMGAIRGQLFLVQP